MSSSISRGFERFNNFLLRQLGNFTPVGKVIKLTRDLQKNPKTATFSTFPVTNVIDSMFHAVSPRSASACKVLPPNYKLNPLANLSIKAKAGAILHTARPSPLVPKQTQQLQIPQMRNPLNPGVADLFQHVGVPQKPVRPLRPVLSMAAVRHIQQQFVAKDPIVSPMQTELHNELARRKDGNLKGRVANKGAKKIQFHDRSVDQFFPILKKKDLIEHTRRMEVVESNEENRSKFQSLIDQVKMRQKMIQRESSAEYSNFFNSLPFGEQEQLESDRTDLGIIHTKLINARKEVVDAAGKKLEETRKKFQEAQLKLDLAIDNGETNQGKLDELEAICKTLEKECEVFPQDHEALEQDCLAAEYHVASEKEEWIKVLLARKQI